MQNWVKRILGILAGMLIGIMLFAGAVAVRNCGYDQGYVRGMDSCR